MLTSAYARRPDFQALFDREVEATSRLSHPNVVKILDYGRLPEEGKLGKGLVAGCPYFVMELADDVVRKSSIESWRDVQDVLESLLRGLAHSHAYDVIHRDIKPGNILRFKSGRIAVADFGISHELERNKPTDVSQTTSRSEEEATGTPRYMAPEQILGKWRDYGPWTDLYSVGIMAYQLITGKAPFKGENLYDVAMRHLNDPLPKIKPKFDIPDGVDAWVRRMTAKDAGERPQSAHDALQELVTISPMTWPTISTERVPYGVGLFGVRRIPAVGRDAEMEQLLELARETRREGATRAVHIRGQRGVGCTTLARWIQTQSSELGILRTFKMDAALDSLSWAVTQHFRTAGLTPEKCHERITLLSPEVSEEEVAGLALMASKTSSPADKQPPASLGAMERQELVRRLLWRIAADTPVVVVLDEPEPATLRFLETCLDAAPAPVLMVVTGSLPKAWPRYEDPRVSLLELSGLNLDSMIHLVRDQIGIPASIARKIEVLADGLPVAAIQLVEHWRQEGSLVVDAQGELELHDAQVPASVADIYQARVPDYLARIMPAARPIDALLALEMAAALGNSWPIDEFEAVLEKADISLRGWQSAMVRSGLIRLNDAHAEFSHPLIRASIIAGSTKQRTWASANAVVSKMLADHYSPNQPGLPRRLAGHLLEAGQAAAATFALNEALKRAREQIAAKEFGALGELLETALTRLKAPEGDIRWAVAWAHRAVPLARSARPDDRDEARKLLKDAVEVANMTTKAVGSIATIKGIAGWATTHLGDQEGGLKLLEESLESTVSGAARMFNLVFLVSLYSHQRRFEEMTRLANEVLENCDVSAWKLRVHETMIHRALIERDQEGAAYHIRAAQTLAQATGQPRMRGHLHNLMGFAADAAADFELAEAEHRQALSIFEVYAEGSSHRLSTEEYLVRAIVQQGRFSEAADQLRSLTARIEAGATGFKFHPVDVEFACAAGLGDWARVEELLDEATRFENVRPNTLHARALMSALESIRAAGKEELDRELSERLRALFEAHDDLSHFQI